MIDGSGFDESLEGGYFIDKYDLDREDSYMVVKKLYRINGTDRSGRLLCTKLTICYDEIKKTGEKCLIEGKISNIGVPFRSDGRSLVSAGMFLSMERTDRMTWDSAVKELVSIVSEYSDSENDKNIADE